MSSTPQNYFDENDLIDFIRADIYNYAYVNNKIFCA